MLNQLSIGLYSWFERLDTDLYGLTAHGREDLGSYPDLAARYTRKLRAAVRRLALPEKNRGTPRVPRTSALRRPVSSP